jgi:hypothetical protein
VVSGCLARLLPHLGEVALAGGVAIALHTGRARPPADLDLVAAGPHAIGRGIAADFLIVHYHLVPRLMVQLVDPATRLRIDVFADRGGAIARARPMAIGGVAPRVLAIEDLLADKLELLAGASPERPVDPKHLRDAELLAARCGRAAPAVAAGCLRAEVYSTDVDARCPRCARSADADFPLAPKAAVFALLGYV